MTHDAAHRAPRDHADPRLRLPVGDLLRRPGSRRVVEGEADLGALAISTAAVPAGEPARYRLRLESVPDGIVVTGTVAAPWEGDCRRCLRRVRGEVHAELQEIFEADPTEAETWPLRGEQIDVAPTLREAILLGLPLAPLCREDCRGLCPDCGADRNEGDCGHAVVERDPRWGALDALRFDD